MSQSYERCRKCSFRIRGEKPRAHLGGMYHFSCLRMLLKEESPSGIPERTSRTRKVDDIGTSNIITEYRAGPSTSTRRQSQLSSSQRSSSPGLDFGETSTEMQISDSVVPMQVSESEPSSLPSTKTSSQTNSSTQTSEFIPSQERSSSEHPVSFNFSSVFDHPNLCFVCRNPSTKRISFDARVRYFIHTQVFIFSHSKICFEHLEELDSCIRFDVYESIEVCSNKTLDFSQLFFVLFCSSQQEASIKKKN